MKINNITTRIILNSAASYTIETTLESDGHIASASVPGGYSKGKNEVKYVEPKEVNEVLDGIKFELIDREFSDQQQFDNLLFDLDGTVDKSKLGGNLILSLSIAFCKVMAKREGLETFEHIFRIHNDKESIEEMQYTMPNMYMLMLEGGLHGSGASSIQEFMAIVDDIERGVEIYKNIKNELHELGKSTNVGAEGAFSPEGYDNDQVLSLLTGFLHGENIALDVAASSFTEEQQIPNYEELIKNYPIFSIEDPYDEEDWAGWEVFASKFADKIIIVTDDLTTTNPKILREAISRKVGNAILVKPNQIGSVSETLEVVKMAHENGWKTVVSHRGTDTNDDFIADLAVGVSSDSVKFGAPARGERVAKYNRLLEIADLIQER